MTPRRILLATDLSCRCDRALDRAVELARGWNATLVAVHALEQPFPVSDAPSWERTTDPRQLAERRIRADAGDAPGLDLDVVVERGDPVPVVLDAGTRSQCDLIVTGVARNETLGRAILGTTVEMIVRRSAVPVLVVKERPRGPYRRIVVATDFSETSRAALVTAAESFRDADLTLFHAYDVPFEDFVTDRAAVRESIAREARREAEAFLASTPLLPATRPVRLLTEYGSPAALLRGLSESTPVDLVVAGTHGRGRAAALVIGSVAQSLLASVPGDVLIVPRAR